jgi:hypothetical protein
MGRDVRNRHWVTAVQTDLLIVSVSPLSDEKSSEEESERDYRESVHTSDGLHQKGRF